MLIRRSNHHLYFVYCDFSIILMKCWSKSYIYNIYMWWWWQMFKHSITTKQFILHKLNIILSFHFQYELVMRSSCVIFFIFSWFPLAHSLSVKIRHFAYTAVCSLSFSYIYHISQWFSNIKTKINYVKWKQINSRMWIVVMKVIYPTILMLYHLFSNCIF